MSTASITAGGAPVGTDATGTAHMPLITWLNTAATRRSTITTDDDPPSAEQSTRTASASCAPTRCCASPPEVARSPPPLPTWARPKPNEVLTEGTAIAPTHSAATRVVVMAPAPRCQARRVSQAADQVPSRISPGNTTGTSRRLAHGWSGTVNGCHSTAADPPRITASGSAQVNPAPDASGQAPRGPRPPRTRIAAPKALSRPVAIPAYQIPQHRVSSEYSRVGSLRMPAIRCSAAM